MDFEKIYATDLVVVPECWKLCGDAHCCSFSRYKRNFRMLGFGYSQELLLFPGEFDFLTKKDLLSQFGEHQHRTIPVEFSSYRIALETLVSKRVGCACDHATRTTVCRLYPLLPIIDVDGTVRGVDVKFGLYEELEAQGGLPRACKIGAIPADQLAGFLTIAGEIARSPKMNFYLAAYHVAKEHLRRRLSECERKPDQSVFALYEGLAFKRQLFDVPLLQAELTTLADKYAAHHGASFATELR
jgi:hypothetical protein